jgi:alpha-glucosidase
MLRLRRELTALDDGGLAWIDDGSPDVLAFRRGTDFACLVNTGTAPAALPADAEVLLASAPVIDGMLPPDAAAWLRLAPHAASVTPTETR